MTSFAEFALAQLPPAPARVLEVGCGTEGGVVEELARAGFEVLGIDPDAPAGARFRSVSLEEFDGDEPFDAAVAARVLHHMGPLETVLDKLARLAPLVVVEEFAWERIDPPTQAWYEAHRHELEAQGEEPQGPADLDEWRSRHTDLHPASVVLRELEARFATRLVEERPYFYRWLKHPPTEAVEAELIASGAIRPIGLRYVGVRR
jgi:SAM-dependent methyltransferase